MSGLELQKTLQAQGISIPVIIITGHGDVSMAVRAMKSGAIDFIEKPFNDEVLLDSIRNAMQKDDALRASQNQTAEVMSNYTHLTPREKEVMSMVTEGRSNKEISSLLNISAKTVEAHRARVMDKMGANSLAKLVRYAIIISTELS
jgi:FixJ family two-component response regulator